MCYSNQTQTFSPTKHPTGWKLKLQVGARAPPRVPQQISKPSSAFSREYSIWKRVFFFLFGKEKSIDELEHEQ